MFFGYRVSRGSPVGICYTDHSVGIKADHSPPSRAEIKKAWSHTSTLSCVSIAYLVCKQLCSFASMCY
jgi:hypothetical protein